MASQHQEISPIIGEEGAQVQPGPGPYVLSADSLHENSVVNLQGERLGDVEAIMLDVLHGRIAYVVLSFGEVLGMGYKLFAIPWEALILAADEKCFVLNVDQERLKNAPGFDRDDWPAMGNPEWANRMHAYYKSSPYRE